MVITPMRICEYMLCMYTDCEFKKICEILNVLVHGREFLTCICLCILPWASIIIVTENHLRSLHGWDGQGSGDGAKDKPYL